MLRLSKQTANLQNSLAIMAFLLKIGAIRVVAEKAVPERHGVWTGIGIISQAIVEAFRQARGFAKIGIGICSELIHL